MHGTRKDLGLEPNWTAETNATSSTPGCGLPEIDLAGLAAVGRGLEADSNFEIVAACWALLSSASASTASEFRRANFRRFSAWSNC